MGYSAKRSKKEVVVTGCEKHVDQLIKAQAHVEIADRLFSAHREPVETQASSERIDSERRGGFIKTVTVEGTKGTASVTFGNRFCKISKTDEKELKKDLGGRLFSELFDEKKSGSVKADKLQDLIDLLGDEAREYLNIDEFLVPVSDFREKRFELRSELSSELNDRIDEVVERIGARPSLKVKSNK